MLHIELGTGENALRSAKRHPITTHLKMPVIGTLCCAAAAVLGLRRDRPDSRRREHAGDRSRHRIADIRHQRPINLHSPTAERHE
jgi:hypothetical protein